MMTYLKLTRISIFTLLALVSGILSPQAIGQIKRGEQVIPSDIASGILVREDGEHIRCLVIGALKGNIFYKSNFKSLKIEKEPISGFSGIFLFDPPAFLEAKKLYNSRKYQEALEKFQECQKLFSKFKGLENNFHDLSVFYTLECYRKLQDYEKMSQNLELFISDKLTRPKQKAQLEIYRLWEMVHSENWERLKALTEEWKGKKVHVGIRAQIAFCEGLAHEMLGEYTEALNAYATAMSADFTQSYAIVRQAALNSLRIYAQDKEIASAIKVWKTEFEDKAKPGYSKLAEANALARMYDKGDLGAGVDLPEEYKKFQKYTTDEMLEALSKE